MRERKDFYKVFGSPLPVTEKSEFNLFIIYNKPLYETYYHQTHNRFRLSQKELNEIRHLTDIENSQRKRKI